jgi:phage terminase small subunit
MKDLTEKQKRFIDFYIEKGNATEAAKLAGYKGVNLNRVGSENLSKLDKEIKKRLEEKEDARIAKQDEILKLLTSIARGEVEEEIPVLVGDGVQNLEKKGTSVKDRLKAAELLGKRYGLYIDNVRVTKPPVIVDDIEEAEDIEDGETIKPDS